MIRRLVLAVVVAIAVALVALLVGMVLVAISVPVLATIGMFLKAWCWVIGLLAGVWHYFAGSWPR